MCLHNKGWRNPLGEDAGTGPLLSLWAFGITAVAAGGTGRSDPVLLEEEGVEGRSFLDLCWSTLRG